MTILRTFRASYLWAFFGVLLAMIVLSFFGVGYFKPLVAIGIATGVGLASAIRAWKGLPLNAFALIAAVLAALGGTVGDWLSNG
ncbi:hypothetical protein [Dyella silvae]|uniref:hypothetical protein n=1 Tax=Dyella silvae TaxID=2994424 RepID=UPI002264307A|nr:hypothetical protein [Dyella silvae]